MSTATGEPVYIRFQRRFNRYRFHYEHQGRPLLLLLPADGHA